MVAEHRLARPNSYSTGVRGLLHEAGGAPEPHLQLPLLAVGPEKLGDFGAGGRGLADPRSHLL